MLHLLSFFVLLTFLVSYQNSQTVSYVASTTNPPHGCPNYALCTDVTYELVSSTNESTVYEYACSPLDCVCVNGTSNSTNPCDTITNQCDPTPCSSTGNYTCTSSINSYTCDCSPGFTGDNCDIEVGSACASAVAACQNGGTCVADASGGGYTCKCAKGFTGDNCQFKNLCRGVNCNNGTCQLVLDASNFYCNCSAGFQGRNCEYSDNSTVAPVKDGCYDYDSIAIAGVTTKFTDSMMTVEKCDSYGASQSPPMGVLTLCGSWCMVTNKTILNTTMPNSDSDCKKKCSGNDTELCGRLNSRCIVYEGGQTVQDTNNCTSNTSLCNDNAGNGKCVNLRSQDDGGYECLCGPLWTGSNCETALPSACDPSPCVNGTCVLNTQYNTQTCDCDDGFTGDICDYPEVCSASTCLYGGTCSEGKNGGYTCVCLSLYSGDQCENIDRCTYQDPCVHGKCSTVINGIEPNFECACEDGYNGTLCDTEINYCDTEPCKYNSTCEPFFKGYKCVCMAGLTGPNCDDIIDLCVPYKVNGVWIKSPCNTKDDKANCTKGINTYTCSCSDKWTDTLCDLNVLIKEVLMAIYGKVDLNMISLLDDLMQNPSEIKDMVPFITGLLTSDQRSNLSWDVGDLFNWIAFEDKRLNLETDIYKWNDVVLGNCFTFNHREQNFTYMMRSPGRHGGILAYMRTRQDEYAPWYDTAAINVFINNKDEYVFSESVRYNAQPHAQTTINIFNTKYTRLGGKYGKCVKQTSEVKAYYYPGSYSTDGCLRTCYQDMIMKACSCMDPRYPKADNTTSCQLSERTCVTEASEEAGDPSTWASCVCPLPCTNQQYSVTWSKADFVTLPIECQMASDVDDCQSTMEDSLLVSVILPQLDIKIYAETAAMDFNKFLSNLGGQLGVLMGINLVSFIEIVFLIAGLFMVCCRKYN